jgi:hypothetical protein
LLAAVATSFNKRSTPSPQIYRFAGGITVFDALVFEFMGLAMLGLCIVVIATPSRRAPVGRARRV